MSVALTYAEALYESAVDGDAVADVARDVSGFADAIEGSAELRAVLDNPEIDTRAKKAVLGELAAGAHPLVGNFLQVLIDRGRIGEFREIARAFGERVAQAQGRLEVQAVTAVPLPADLRERIVNSIREKTGSEVELTESVDPEIIGGLVLRVGAAVVDGSVRHRIDELRQSLRGASVDSAIAAS
ncbi:MAG: ATP synthase F1 subunit delta [Thermoleophilia bacterium]